MRALGPAVLGCLLLAGCGTIPPVPTTSASPAPTTSAPSSPAASSPAASSSSPPAGPSSATTSSGGAGTCEYAPSGTAAKPVKLPPTTGVPTTGTVSYLLTMTNGPVVITMDRAKAPCTVNSFTSLADQGFYDKTKCGRLADSGIFILQCGDPTGTTKGGPGYQFANETDGTETYTTGVVAMANAGPDTNGSQFFFVWDDSTSLDKTPNYTIFGRLDKDSRDVVASMAAEGQDGSAPDGTGRPNNPSEIISAKRK